ncbi:MAG: peptidoglycan-associated lipoprotein Pal [bacterium]
MKTMKTWMGMMAVLVLALAMGAGCGSSSKAKPGTNTTGERSATPGSGENGGNGVPGDTRDPMSSYNLADIHFDFDRYDIRSSDRETLSRHGQWLTDNPGTRIMIEGHCDERGTVEYNLALGEKRARSAKDFLENYGVPASRLEMVSYGKERPLDPGHDESAWARNRRASFVKR